MSDDDSVRRMQAAKAENGYKAAPQEEKTSGFALASLAFGVLGFFAMPVVGSIIAIVLGVVARRRIDASGGREGGRPLANAGVTLGGVALGLALIVAMFAIRF